MKKIRLILMHNGRVEKDFIYQGNKPKLNETITIENNELGHLDYNVKIIQHFFNENLEFKYLLIK